MVCLIEDGQFLSLGVYGRRHLAHSTLWFHAPDRKRKEQQEEEHRKYNIHTERKRKEQ